MMSMRMIISINMQMCLTIITHNKHDINNDDDNNDDYE